MFELIIVIIAYATIPLMLWMIFASISVRTTYSKFNAMPASCGMTAEQAARKILDINGLFDVNIGKCSGTLTDHYDPRNNTVYLSASTINSASIAAIAVAAHEVGHAIQHAEGYAPIKMRGALVPVVNIISRMITPFLLLGIIFEFIAVRAVRSIYVYYFALRIQRKFKGKDSTCRMRHTYARRDKNCFKGVEQRSKNLFDFFLYVACASCKNLAYSPKRKKSKQ